MRSSTSSAGSPAMPDLPILAFLPGDGVPITPGAGGVGLGLIVAIVAGVVVGAALVAAIGYLVLRRRAGMPMEPPPGAPEGGEWWTCRKCGRNNIVGSARCYACGEWQR